MGYQAWTVFRLAKMRRLIWRWLKVCDGEINAGGDGPCGQMRDAMMAFCMCRRFSAWS
jgi:hypothetical protein